MYSSFFDTYQQYVFFENKMNILFLVEKSLANINCLIAYVFAEGQKNIRVHRRIIRGYFWCGFRLIRFSDIAVSTNRISGGGQFNQSVFLARNSI